MVFPKKIDMKMAGWRFTNFTNINIYTKEKNEMINMRIRYLYDGNEIKKKQNKYFHESTQKIPKLPHKR